MIALYVFTAIILLLQTSCHLTDHVLTLTWLGGFCRNQKMYHQKDQCTEQQLKQWDHQSFTIYRLRYNDQRAIKLPTFYLQYLQKHPSLLDDMINYWPSLHQQHIWNDKFWKLQWQNFGSQYYNLLLRTQGGKNQQQLLVQYFQDTINLYKQFSGLQKLSKNVYSANELASLMNIPRQYFHIKCLQGQDNDKEYLHEINICFNHTKKGNQPTKCENQHSLCRNTDNLIFDLWENTNTDRVTKIAKSPIDTDGQQTQAKLIDEKTQNIQLNKNENIVDEN